MCLLAFGAGNTIYMYTLSQGVQEDLAIQVHRESLPAMDITGLAFLPTIGATRRMLITDMSGRVVRRERVNTALGTVVESVPVLLHLIEQHSK